MKMKKIAALFLSGILAAGTLAGCQGGQDTEDTSSTAVFWRAIFPIFIVMIP